MAINIDITPTGLAWAFAIFIATIIIWKRFGTSKSNINSLRVELEEAKLKRDIQLIKSNMPVELEDIKNPKTIRETIEKKLRRFK